MINESKYISLDHVPIDSLNNYPLHYISGLQGETDYEFTDKQSYLDYLTRFEGIPAITDTIIQNMTKGLKYKDTLPRLIVLDLRDQYNEFLSLNLDTLPFPSYIKQTVIDKINLYIVPSVKKIKHFLEKDYLFKCTDKLGLSSLKGGKSIYKGLLEEQTIKGYTPKDIHNLGLREIKQILSKINALKRKMKFKGTIHEFYEYCSKSFKTKQDVINHSKKLQNEIYKKIYPKYFNKDLDYKDLASIEKIKENKSRQYAFYIGTKKRGTFYVNTSIYNELNIYELITLSLHESIPGHHLQLMTHNRNKNIPLYIQNSHNTGYIEGWGLYCENFTDLHNNKELVYKYMYELQRAVRLVVDTGIHVFNWSYDKSFSYMKKYLNYSDTVLKNEIIRYICIPTQALSYKVGELTLLFLRDKYLQKYPNDIKGFHKLVFDIGPCSLDLLISEFIKKNI